MKEALYTPFSLSGHNFTLLKDFPSSSNEEWKVGGIASSESMDEHGDVITKDLLDISYLQKRGYINWSHSHLPEDQIGVVTVAEIISPSSLKTLESKLGFPLPSSSSLYVEGILYKNVRSAKSVYNIMSSLSPGMSAGLGFSVEGSLVKEDDKITKAIVRGVAITPSPAQVETLCALIKSFNSGWDNQHLSNVFSFGQAVSYILSIRPHFSKRMAERVVQFALNRK